jgi:amino acid permease
MLASSNTNAVPLARIELTSDSEDGSSSSTDARKASVSDETKPLSFELTSENGETEDNSESTIPKTASWETAGLLMIADVVGAGVMSLATAFAQLGWLPSFCSLVFWYVVNMYIGVLIGECHEAWPHSESFMDLSQRTYGRRARIATGCAVYSFLAFVLGDYVLILGETLQMMFYETKMCGWFWTGIGVLFLLPLSFVRLLALTNKLMVLNLVTIVGSIMLALGRLASMDEAEIQAWSLQTNHTMRQTEVIAADISLMSFFHSQALFAFAYIGVFIYLEIIAEMRNPKEFKKSLLMFSGPFQFTVYALTGSIGYFLIGKSANGLLIKQIPQGTAFRVSAFLLAVHMVLTFMVKGTVLSRAIHMFVSPETAKDFSSLKAYRVFFFVATAVMLFCFFVANLIPFFDDLTALLGALQTPFVGFVLPIMFVLKARKKLQRDNRKYETRFMALIIAFMVLLFFVGLATSTSNIISKWQSYGSPFKGCV